MAERVTVRLNEDEIWSFLEQGHTGILTSLRRDGTPIALPVWYAVHERTVAVVSAGKQAPPQVEEHGNSKASPLTVAMILSLTMLQ